MEIEWPFHLDNFEEISNVYKILFLKRNPTYV